MEEREQKRVALFLSVSSFIFHRGWNTRRCSLAVGLKRRVSCGHERLVGRRVPKKHQEVKGLTTPLPRLSIPRTAEQNRPVRVSVYVYLLPFACLLCVSVSVCLYVRVSVLSIQGLKHRKSCVFLPGPPPRGSVWGGRGAMAPFSRWIHGGSL